MTKQDGIKLREARRARVRRIRARVIGGSVALFLAIWMLITVVLVTGHDPALARKTVTQPAAATTSSTSSTGVTGSSGSSDLSGSTGSTGSSGSSGSSDSTGSTGSGATSSSTGSGSSGLSSVTSSQS